MNRILAQFLGGGVVGGTLNAAAATLVVTTLEGEWNDAGETPFVGLPIDLCRR